MTTRNGLWGRCVMVKSRIAGTCDRRDRIGGQDRWDRTDRTGQQGGYNCGRTVQVWQLGQDH
jgi:hypothetical protein